jgi:3,4-dihydroxy 2-butanone 4-phosphate synthase/GTP cyclohydrolase II
VFTPIPELLEALSAGKPIILVDDENRENEGDLVIAAEFATPEAIAFMAKQASGLICLALSSDMVEDLGLELIGKRDNAHHDTAFLMPIEAKTGVTTGISAADRARTIAVAIDPDSTPADLATPGHIFPLRAHPGGVLARRGHTEAGVDLCAMAGLRSAAVICEIMNEDGTMARRPQIEVFAKRWAIPVGTIDALTLYLTQQAA